MKKISVITLALLLILSSATVIRKGYDVGDKVRDFELKNVNGKNVSMEANAGNKGYIIVFTCNTCPWARAYENRIIDLHKKYADKGYPVIAIQPNDPDL